MITAEILKKHFGINDQNFIKTILNDPKESVRYWKEYLGSFEGRVEEFFFKKWMNKGLDIDKTYGNQCKDVFSQFNKDIVGAPYIVGDPIVMWNKYDTLPTLRRYYEKINNTLLGVPRIGDVIIFKLGSTGHISICTRNANVLYFTSFDQNWPKQGYYDKNGNFIGTGVCHYVTHNYLSPQVVGWFRTKL